MHINAKKTLSIIILLLKIQLFAQNSYSFFVAGHIYGEPEGTNLSLYNKFVKKFNFIKSRSEIKFGILTGDIV